jgi:UDP-N-acetylglucosamine 4,6-dehydratase
MKGGEIFVPKLKSFRVIDLIKAFDNKLKIKKIGIRPGEKLHEVMCPKEEVQNILEFKNYYVIYPSISYYMKNLYKLNLNKKLGKKVQIDFEYNSSDNKEFLTVNQLKMELKKLSINDNTL